MNKSWEYVITCLVLIAALIFIIVTYRHRPEWRTMKAAESTDQKTDEVLKRLDRIEKILRDQ